jgi:hypothetical protein
LIKELAAEGYIPQHFEYISDGVLASTSLIEWRNDPLRRKRLPMIRRSDNRFMVRLFLTIFALWLSLLIFAFLHAARVPARPSIKAETAPGLT